MRGALPRYGRVRRGVAAWLFAAALATALLLATAERAAAIFPPTASFTISPNPVLTGETVTFDASASETDIVGTPITKYEWDLDGDGQFEIEETDPVTSRSYAAPAIIEISLRVTDQEGDTDVETHSLTVQNRDPIASFTASPNPALTGETVNFDATGSTDEDGTIVRYDWDLDGDGEFETQENDPMISKSYADPAIIEISLRVTDGEGATDVETHSLTVRDTQRPLAAFAATPNPALTGETVTFDASASATDIGDIPITKYEWDLDGDGQFEIEDNDSLTAESYADPAIIEISLRVTDEEGDTDVETRSLTVENRAPIAAFRYSPRAPEVGERVEFTSRSIDPDGTLRAVRWDLDGNGGFGNARGKTVVRSFSKPGEHSVGLKATDSHGATDETVRTVVVVKPAPSFIVPFPVVRIAGRVSRGHADRPTLRQGGAGIEGHGALPRTKLPGQGNHAAGEEGGGALSPAGAVAASRHAHRGESHATRPDRQVHPIQDACAQGAGAARSLPPARRPAASALHGRDEPKAGSHRLCARRRGIRGRLCRRAGRERRPSRRPPTPGPRRSLPPA